MTSYVLGGGCFWCLDAVYRMLRGVTKVESGYAGGDDPHPNYYRVASGKTGHAEVVRVTFDESIIPSEVILDLFFLIHDPTTLNRQGADVGTEYRSTMLYSDTAQQEAFEAARQQAGNVWKNPIVTEIAPLEEFYIAEDEHQDFFNKYPGSGYCSIVIVPKVVTARAAYKKWFKES